MFDREVVETLLKYVPLYPKGTMVTLSDGREAIIYENFGVHNLRPVVRLMDGELLDLSNEANYHITLRMKTESGFSTEEAEKERNEMIRPPVRCRIMVVDDMKTNLQMLRGILEPLYDVILMKSGHQALLYLKNIGAGSGADGYRYAGDGRYRDGQTHYGDDGSHGADPVRHGALRQTDGHAVPESGCGRLHCKTVQAGLCQDRD